jgi:hypothetical protein
LHESVVHGLLSLQSAFVAQQPAVEVTVQLFCTLHAVVVHLAEFVQSAAALQQPEMGSARHLYVAASHESVVHGSLSSQAPSAVQQVGLLVWLQVLVAVSHFSAVQGSPSSQSASVWQQSGVLVTVHLPVFASQVAVTQALVPLQSVSSTQQGMGFGLDEHRWETVSHVSTVQSAPSSQSELVEQHPVMAGWVHWCVVALQMSPVQILVSAQSAAERQQFASAVFAHFPAVQASVVQSFESSQSAATLQHPVIFAKSQRFVVRLQESVVQVLLSLHAAFALQQSVAAG